MTTPDDNRLAFPFVSHGAVSDHQCCDSGMTLREYFAAHAPPIPAAILNRYIEVARTNEPKEWELPWSEWHYARIATQEARWRKAYADALIAALKARKP